MYIDEIKVGTNQFKSLYLEICNCIDDIRSDPKNIDNLESLRLYINRFFEHVAKCEKIEYTENIDKLFFGTYIQSNITLKDFYPMIHNKDVTDSFKEPADPFTRFYRIELDSKLFSDDLGLNSYEITSLLLYNIGAMISDNSSIKTIIKAIDKYCIENNKVLYYDAKKIGLLDFAIQSTLQDITSIFKKNNIDNILNDNSTKVILDYYSKILKINFFEIDLTYGFRKVYNNISMFKNNNFLTLSWGLRNYFNFKNSLIPILHTLAKCKTLSASNLEKISLKKLIFSIGDTRSDYNKDLSDLDVVMESSKLYNKLSIDLKKSQDNYDMIKLRSMNINDNNEISDDDLEELIKEINIQMMNFKNCYNSEKSLSPIEMKQMNEIYTKFNKLRKNLYKKASFYYKDITLYNKWNKQNNQ